VFFFIFFPTFFLGFNLQVYVKGPLLKLVIPLVHQRLDPYWQKVDITCNIPSNDTILSFSRRVSICQSKKLYVKKLIFKKKL